MVLSVSVSQAQEWPLARPIKFIVSQAAGSTPDIICRILADQLSPLLGQAIVIENRPGGGVPQQAGNHRGDDGSHSPEHEEVNQQHSREQFDRDRRAQERSGKDRPAAIVGPDRARDEQGEE